MAISDKLAFEIYVIILFHTVAVLVLFSFSVYLYFRARKTALLFSYLAVAAAILLWMISKILKTVAPTEILRWFFILTQYLGIDTLGLFLIIFAFVYVMGRVPSAKIIVALSVLPLLSFVVILTNPLHMTFYSYFDFYKDRFGPSFYILQSIQYVYWIAGILMLSRGFTKQRGFHGKRGWAILFSVITLLPVAANVYYILFKISIFPWIFPFPIFDFTPIAASAALILFMIPAVSFRFFDLTPVSYGTLFEELPRGLVFMNKRGLLYGGNRTFKEMFSKIGSSCSIDDLAGAIELGSDDQKAQFISFAHDGSRGEIELTTLRGTALKVTKKPLQKSGWLFCLTDISELVEGRETLVRQNLTLQEATQRLTVLAENTQALAVTRAKAQAAQDMHDILGHSLTVVIATADLAASETEEDAGSRKLTHVSELLISGMTDLKNTLSGKSPLFGQTSLLKALSHLKNDSIILELTVQGGAYELTGAQTEAVFRLCQEAITNAIKHGSATQMNLILRYKPTEFEVYAINDGAGCSDIVKSHGLTGIEARLTELSGCVDFGSDGEKGFTIHAVLPKVK